MSENLSISYDFEWILRKSIDAFLLGNGALVLWLRSLRKCYIAPLDDIFSDRSVENIAYIANSQWVSNENEKASKLSLFRNVSVERKTSLCCVSSRIRLWIE